MEFNFRIKGDRLIAGETLVGNSGNLNTYSCKFDIVTNPDFLWICVFRKEGNAYQQVIENGTCVLPAEVLENPGFVEIGCYATSDGKRISTNWLKFNVGEGAYCDATIPIEPTPDVWETLVMNAIPYIGENGNWYVYNKETKQYGDSGCASRGEKGDKGDAPKRGVDYWTQEDKNQVLTELENDLNFESRLAKVVGTAGNSLKKTVSGESLKIDDISPLEHLMTVSVRSKNIAYEVVCNDVTGSTSAEVIGAKARFFKGKTYTISFDTQNTGATLKFVTYERPIKLVTSDRVVADGTRKSITFTMSDDFIKNYRITLVQLFTTNFNSGLCSNIQIEEGTSHSGYTEYVGDLSDMVLSVYEGESQANLLEYIPDADGTVVGVISQYPVTAMGSDTRGVVINCEYNRDINKAYEELVDAIISLGGNV